MKTKARFFACHLDDYLQKVDKKFSGVSAIYAITSIAYEIPSVDRKVAEKWIRDHREKKAT